MRTLKIFGLCFFSLFCFSINSKCQQFIPNELKQLPKDSVAELNIYSIINEQFYPNCKTVKSVFIDNVKVNKKIVYLRQGEHDIKGKFLIENEKYKVLVVDMKNKGFKLSNDGLYWERYNGNIKTTFSTLFDPPQFNYVEKSQMVTLKKRGKYNLEEIVKNSSIK